MFLYIDFPIAAEGVPVHPDALDTGDTGSHCCVAVPTLTLQREWPYEKTQLLLCASEGNIYKFQVLVLAVTFN